MQIMENNLRNKSPTNQVRGGRKMVLCRWPCNTVIVTTGKRIREMSPTTIQLIRNSSVMAVIPQEEEGSGGRAVADKTHKNKNRGNGITGDE